MELKPDYERTPIGVMPREWTVKRLRDRLVQPATYGVVKAGAFGRSGVPMLRSGDVKDGRVSGDQPLISEAKSKEYSRTVLRPDDVVIALVGYPGETAVVPSRLTGANISRALGLLRPDKSLTPEFLKCYLNSPMGRKEFLRPGAGSAQIVVNLRDLNNLRLPVPPVIEQGAITAALNDVDQLIMSVESLIEKTRDLKQVALQRLATGLQRLPSFHGDWAMTQLGNVGSCLRGVTYAGDSDLSPHDTPRTKRLLRSNNVQNFRIVTADLQFVNAQRVTDIQILRRGDILICMANGSRPLVGKAALFTLSDGHEYTFGAFMGCFRRASTECDSAFLSYLLQTNRYRNNINNVLAGSSINNLNPGSIESMEVLLPDLTEQVAIAGVLSDMDADIGALERQRHKLATMKIGLTQELLSGRIRLPRLQPQEAATA